MSIISHFHKYYLCLEQFFLMTLNLLVTFQQTEITTQTLIKQPPSKSYLYDTFI